MTLKTEYTEKLAKIKENAKYLKLTYSFHNAKELIEEHTTLKSSIADFYSDLLQRESDIRYENGQIVTDYTKRAKTDQSLKGINNIANEEGMDVANKVADAIIKNTYRTWMTRGMKGCYVYCVDKCLQEYLKNKSNVL